MNAEFSIRWTDDLRRKVRRFLLGRLWNEWGWLLLLMLFLLLLFERYSSEGSMMRLFLAATVAYMLFDVVRSRRLVCGGQRKLGDYDMTYGIDDEAIRYQSRFACGLVPWNKCKGLIRRKDIWILCPSGESYLVLPADAMAGNVGEFVLGKVRENGGKVK
jgi:hypothetical protein